MPPYSALVLLTEGGATERRAVKNVSNIVQDNSRLISHQIQNTLEQSYEQSSIQIRTNLK